MAGNVTLSMSSGELLDTVDTPSQYVLPVTRPFGIMILLVVGLVLLLPTVVFSIIRLYAIIPYFTPTAPPRFVDRKARPAIMILLGSGGHTAEMLSLFSAMSPDHYNRTYVFSSGDTFSAAKAIAFERALGHSKSGKFGYKLIEIPRARRVGQSWFTTPFSCLACLWGCLKAFMNPGIPNTLVCNGPGSAVMMVAICLLFRFLGFKTRTVYVESFARVKTLSLSGKLLYPFVDRFIVQWPGLKEKWRRAEYLGVLV